jgi:hypothetical protein
VVHAYSLPTLFDPPTLNTVRGVATSSYFDERATKSNRRAQPEVVEPNDDTCTIVHGDVTDDLDATFALCHLHTSTPPALCPFSRFRTKTFEID